MIPRHQDIRAVYWQPRLGAGGQVVEDLADIAQCIAIILLTPKGSDPHRPEFASDCWKYIDWPVDQAVPHLVREAVLAIERWEPRVILVGVEPVIENARITLRVTWRLAADAAPQVTEVAL
ncbi:GPW/gp25 family protein [Rhodospirillum centenum]|uniref:Phage baseplate protein, putative n=1 Tax=Rhodospirillum centenum (strain ATCC 51521 / SW) TaxID=414684 RepID=B6IMG9_RHOCS|nr:GPW/gp25 family protein [Rhodospirillum centenum]ACI98548.1 phage baseplate protein, putative [Rhodospirillum centenum SW]